MAEVWIVADLWLRSTDSLLCMRNGGVQHSLCSYENETFRVSAHVICRLHTAERSIQEGCLCGGDKNHTYFPET